MNNQRLVSSRSGLRSFPLALLAVWVYAPGCGGVARSDGSAGSSGAGGVAGNGDTGGASAALSTGGWPGPCDPHTVRSPCVTACRPEPFVESTCVDGRFQCPEGYFESWTCPKDSCVLGSDTCCREATGAVFQIECGSDDKFTCPPDTRPLDFMGACIPPQLGVTSCRRLEGACDEKSLSCLDGFDFCPTHCVCTAGGSGELTWRCTSVRCR